MYVPEQTKSGIFRRQEKTSIFIVLIDNTQKLHDFNPQSCITLGVRIKTDSKLLKYMI